LANPHIKDYLHKRVHMIGIGGSSMSGLARMLHEKGFALTGSDNLETYSTRSLRAMGIPVVIGHHPENVHNADLIVYTVAVSADNVERMEAARLQIPSIERAELLGQLMDGCPTAVAVCGTHGKTTTTSMIAQILMAAQTDPTIHIGGSLDLIGGNVRTGKGDIFLTEACEFNLSFMHLRPDVAVITNIDEDHLDFFRDIDHIQSSFQGFLSLVPPGGTVIGNGDDLRVAAVLGALKCQTLTYGMTSSCDVYPADLRFNELGHGSFGLVFRGETLGHVELQIGGKFNVYNALAAAACAVSLGLPMQTACGALSAFQGARRRFELTGVIDGVKLYHDYGHNPAEMQNVLSIAKLQPHNRLWAVMQPHTYSRVKKMLPQYFTSTLAADITLVTDIYAAREKDPGDIFASQIVEGMNQSGAYAVHTPTFDDTEAYLRAHWQPGDLVLTMGCGNINQLNELMNEHERKKQGGLRHAE
jgi:UDP-N-acetylmuramate--alanine ligase